MFNTPGKMLLFLLFVIGNAVQQVSPMIYYVDVTRGAKNNDGMTVDTPFLTIQECVDVLSEPGDECRIR